MIRSKTRSSYAGCLKAFVAKSMSFLLILIPKAALRGPPTWKLNGSSTSCTNTAFRSTCVGRGETISRRRAASSRAKNCAIDKPNRYGRQWRASPHSSCSEEKRRHGVDQGVSPEERKHRNEQLQFGCAQSARSNVLRGLNDLNSLNRLNRSKGPNRVCLASEIFLSRQQPGFFINRLVENG